MCYIKIFLTKDKSLLQMMEIELPPLYFMQVLKQSFACLSFKVLILMLVFLVERCGERRSDRISISKNFRTSKERNGVVLAQFKHIWRTR
jgi:hypothetical protein